MVRRSVPVTLTHREGTITARGSVSLTHVELGLTPFSVMLCALRVAETIEEQEGENSRLSRWIRTYGLWAVLLVAVTPLPDTPIVLLAGSNKLPFGRLFIVEAVGKTVLYSIGAIVGGFVFTGLTGAFGGVGASALMVAGSLVFCVLVTWKKSRDVLFGWFERLFD